MFGDDDGPTLSGEARRTWFDDVLDFYRFAAGEETIPRVPSVTGPMVPLYGKLIKEEEAELATAIDKGDIPGIADGYADRIWTIIGEAIARGIDLRPVWEEVARANLAKIHGPRRPDGKLLKPAGWKPPDIVKALRDGRLR